jgi:hypothetical protein
MTATLPDGFSPKFFILPERLGKSEYSKTLFIPEAASLGMLGVDCNLYYPGNVPPDQNISGNHSHVYVEGNLGANAKISVRQGIVSAHALEQGSEVKCGGIIVVEDMQASLSSLNLSERGREPLIIQVPPGKRKEVFLELVNEPHQSGQYEKRMAHLSDEAIDAMGDEEFRQHYDKAMGAYMGHECWREEVIGKALDSLQERGLIVSTSRTFRFESRNAGEKRGR